MRALDDTRTVKSASAGNEDTIRTKGTRKRKDWMSGSGEGPSLQGP